MQRDLDDATAPAARPRVAILGGGMAGLSAAWRLSEPGWRDQFESITVYQRGWRLGGKGASSRGPNGRIEEHGLHVWLGYYDNAFRLIRECYSELDRDRTDPTSPIRTWRDAFIPSSAIAMEDLHAGTWSHWLGQFTENDLLPGEPDGSVGSTGPVDMVLRSLQLLMNLVDSFDTGAVGVQLSPDTEPSSRPGRGPASVAMLAAGAMVESLAWTPADRGPEVSEALNTEVVAALDAAVAAARTSFSELADPDDATRRTWHFVGVIAAAIRGLIAEQVMSDPQGFRRLNEEDFCDWIRRHGAPEEAVQSTWVRGLYDLVFAHVDGNPLRQDFGAGVGVFLGNKILFGYKGSIFWKMTAGMGDVVFAPLHEALQARGVDFEFFHRVDALHVSNDGQAIDAITVGRQVDLVPTVDRYEPLVRVKGLSCFPDAPLVEQLACGDEVLGQPLESIWCTWPDAELRVLRRGVDFDEVVFAIPPAMAAEVCQELIAQRTEWREMVGNIGTVATQAFQLWLREDEPSLGWPHVGATSTGFVDGFDTWASMPQLIEAEDWPSDDHPRAIAYFCNTFDSAWPPLGDRREHAAREAARVRDTAIRFCSTDLRYLFPHAVTDEGFRWDLLCGSGPETGTGDFDGQFWSANVDPSDRYVQSRAGTDKFRLRSDESGFDNLVLAGDWTDNGLNAGCIEAAVLSGLQAANALLRRHRFHRILGTWLP